MGADDGLHPLNYFAVLKTAPPGRTGNEKAIGSADTHRNRISTGILLGVRQDSMHIIDNYIRPFLFIDYWGRWVN